MPLLFLSTPAAPDRFFLATTALDTEAQGANAAATMVLAFLLAAWTVVYGSATE